jgi:prepilin-type N-terminal cleavage/methylation domain-containing protein
MRPQQTRDSLRVMQRHSDEWAFTLIELLVVMTLIAILLGIGYPAFTSVMNQARKTQAKNEEQQIVAAVNAYYTDYGKYPVGATVDTTYGSGGTANGELFFTLRAVAGGTLNAGDAANPRKIVFIQPPVSKDQISPRSGIQTLTSNWYDPWGSQYNVRIDGDYNNQLTTNPYPDAPGGQPGQPLNNAVIVWSFGADLTPGTKSPASPNYSGSDDVISWQ